MEPEILRHIGIFNSILTLDKLPVETDGILH